MVGPLNSRNRNRFSRYDSTDDIIKKLEDWFRELMKPLYPVVTSNWFYLLPIPAAYNLIDMRLIQGQNHDDGYDGKRLKVVGANAVLGSAIWFTNIEFLFTWFMYYLALGAAYYALFRWIVPVPSFVPDMDPCGNPSTRGGGTGGGGAC